MPSRDGYWLDTNVATQIASGADAAAQFLDNNLTIQELRGVTLIRTIIDLQVMTTTEGGVEGISSIFAGIGVSSREAFAAGTGALPSPDVNTDKPTLGWVWRSPGVQPRWQVDIRAARVLNNGRLYLVMQNTNIAGTGFSIQIVGMIRCFVKAP